MEHKNPDKRMFPPNMIRICIDQYAEDVNGRIYTKLSEVPLLFDNCCELFLRTDALFDRCGYPQTFQEKRDFYGKRNASFYTAPKVCLSDEELDMQQGKLGTLDVYIRSRRNTGWQGIIKSCDGAAPVEFQSEIELLSSIRHLFSKKKNDTEKMKEEQNT